MVVLAVDLLRQHTHHWRNSGLHLSRLAHTHVSLAIDTAHRAFALRLTDNYRYSHAVDVPRERPDTNEVGHASVHAAAASPAPADDPLRRRSELEQPGIMVKLDT